MPDDHLECYRCHKVKPATEFNWRRKAINQRDSFCRPWRAMYKQEHYTANKQRYVDNAAKTKARLRHKRTLYLLDYFETHPCADCGVRDPVVLEFDHLRDKCFNIGSEISRRTWASVLEEIEKCEVVCANCHRRRTARAGLLSPSAKGKAIP